MPENTPPQQTPARPPSRHDQAAVNLRRQKTEREKLKKFSRYEAAAKDVARKKARKNQLIKGYLETKF